MIVLDTHVVIWLIEGDARLGQTTRHRISEEQERDTVMIPAICIWEIALLASRDKIQLSLDIDVWINLALALPGFRLVPLEPEIAVKAVDLDWAHRDPSDRFIVATASYLEAPVVTVDHEILRYAAAGHVKAIDASV